MTADRLTLIKEILDAFAHTGAEQLEVTQGSLRLRILKRRRECDALQPANSAGCASDAAIEVARETLTDLAGRPVESEAVDGVVVRASMHGTFHRAPAPGAEPFVSEDCRVARGQKLCILEAMKLFNPVTAPLDGMVVAIHAENGEEVKAGDPLFTLSASPARACSMNSDVVVLEKPRVSLCGNAALLLEAEGQLALPTQERIWRLSDTVRSWNGVVDTQPGMNNLLVVLDPVEADPVELSTRLLEVWPTIETGRVAGRLLEVGVVYGGEGGQDLPDVAAYHRLEPEVIVSLHAAREYIVFAPSVSAGYGYLFGLDPQLFTPDARCR